MRRFASLRRVSFFRSIVLPWNSILPSYEDPRWKGVGRRIVEIASRYDTGKAAFDECCEARGQLESIIQSAGYDINVYIFGGLVTLGIFEVGGDVDFVGVSEIEPDNEEAAEIVRRVARELRRLGLKAWSVPKARVPVVKADRISKSLPGSPFHSLSYDGVFQFTRQANTSEVKNFQNRLRESYGAVEVEWSSTFQLATVKFNSTSSLMHALSHIKCQDDNDIFIRLPVDVGNGPEIYRFPFDFCLSSTGLRNSYLLADALSKYTYSRHILLMLKKWGRACGIINSIDGLLASYALTVMFVHFLIKVGLLSQIMPMKSTGEPHLLEVTPLYRPLAKPVKEEMAQVGFLFASFLEYFGMTFNYADSVVCTTNMNLTKNVMRWDKSTQTCDRPPFFHFAIKDSYGLDNIGRNLDHESTKFVQESHALALKSLLEHLSDPYTVLNILTKSPPRLQRVARLLSERGIRSEVLTEDQMEGRYVLKKMRFHERKKAMENLGINALKNNANQYAASKVAKDVLGWIKSDENS